MRARTAGLGTLGALFFLTGAVLGTACKKKGDANADAATDAAVEAAVEDAGATAEAEDAAADTAAPLATTVKTAAPAPKGIEGLPKSCVDQKGGLGTLTFAVSGNNVTITSSTTKAKATCTKKDDQYLLCDWVGTDGKPTVSGRKVGYGAKRAVAGNYDSTHIFSCPPQ